MTREVYERLESEVRRLIQSAAGLPSVTGNAPADEDAAVARVPAAWTRQHHERQLESLRQLLDVARVVPQDGVAIVGSQVTVRDSDEEPECYTVVLPGEADPRAGRISFESPLGRALLGRRAGETVAVAAPGGEREVTVVRVDAADDPTP